MHYGKKWGVMMQTMGIWGPENELKRMKSSLAAVLSDPEEGHSNHGPGAR